MPLNRLNVYADSDFCPDALEIGQPIVLDLAQMSIYEVNGEAMVKLSELQKSNIPIKGLVRPVSQLPLAA